MEVSYVGTHLRDGVPVVFWYEDGKCGRLSARTDVANWSGEIMNWPSFHGAAKQLALALCIHALGDVERALACYVDFAREVVSALNYDHWILTQSQIWDWWLRGCSFGDLREDCIDLAQEVS